MKVCRQIWEALGAQQPNLQQVLTKTAYDGRKSAFIPKQFPFGEGSETFTVTLPAHNVRDVPDARPREFKVKIDHAQDVDMSALAKWLAKGAAGPSFADAVAIAIQALASSSVMTNF